MGNNPYESPHTASGSPVPQANVLGRRLIQLFLVVGVVGLLVALLLPSVRTAREPARRAQCTNNLRQIGLALRNYESVYHCLPPAYTVDADGKPLHSWRSLILPYLEQQPLYKKIDLSKPWNDLANKEARETELSVYHCPSADFPRNHTTYFAVVAPNGCFRPTEPRKLSEITDNAKLTLMVVEADVDHAVPWMSPTDADEQMILNLRSATRLPHPGGTQAVCVSGDTLFLNSDLDATTLQALISIAGHDDAAAQQAN